MNRFLATSALRFGGATAIQPAAASVAALPPRAAADPAAARASMLATAVDHEALLHVVFVPQVTPPPQSLPLAASRNGNLFVDRNDPNLHWYLPGFVLHEDPDTAFAFAARQSGQDSNGNPFSTATLSLRVSKRQPDDVAAFAKANPTATLREIPLAELSATLTSVYTDETGQEKQRAASVTLTDQGGGDFLLRTDPAVIGPLVIGLYQDLTVFGKAQIRLSAAFQVWTPRIVRPLIFSQFAVQSATALRPLSIAPVAAAHASMPMLQRIDLDDPDERISRRPVDPDLLHRHPIDPHPVNPPPAVDPLVQARQTWETQLPLGLKYKLDGYQLKYTLSIAPSEPRPIRDANDLRDFAHSSSEFEPLMALGDINARYPSLSRAYIGVLSRTIVVIPSRYAIVRNRSGCAAQCVALVDSAASNGSKCKFEFDFTLAPEVSRIEFLQFAQEISRNADLKGYSLKFPDFLQDSVASTLQTTFKSTAQFAAGVEPNTFALSVAMQDDGAQTPAVANANLLIQQLCSSIGTPLTGTISLKLDDAYTAPVLAPVVLNFAHTAGTDELTVQIDETAAQIHLTNASPLDLQLARYALVTEAAISVVPAALQLPAGAAVSIALPAEHAGLALAVDSQLAVPKPLEKADVGRFLNFQTADVQQTQYVIAIDGGGVNFGKVDSILASITFASLPSVVPRVLSLSKNVRADSTHIVIPLENAVFSLPGTVHLTVKFADATAPDLNFTVANDFTAVPVLVLLQSDIDKNLSNP